MKRVFLVVLVCFMVIINGYSQTKQELIKELFSAMQQDSLMDKTFGSMLPALMKQLQSQAKDSSSIARSQAAIAKTEESMKMVMPIMKDMVKRLLSEDMVLIYDKYFSEEDIKNMIAFYRTPTGLKFIRTQPEIQKELMPIMFQKYIPEMQKAMKAKLEELKAQENK